MTTHRNVTVTVRLLVQLADDYTGEIPQDVEEDLRFDLEEGQIRDGVALTVQDVSAGLIADNRPLLDDAEA